MPTETLRTKRCSHQMHYGTLGPKFHNGPSDGQDWQGYCGMETSNRVGVCDECIAFHNDNYPQNPIHADDNSPNRRSPWMADAPTLYDADTNERIGEATTHQVSCSIKAAKKDGGAGIIRVDRTTGLVSSDGRRCYTDKAPAGDMDPPANGRWMTAGELRAHLEAFPDDTPVSVEDAQGGNWLNISGATDPYESGEESIILLTRNDFDPRQW